jgi:hypothetical protein
MTCPSEERELACPRDCSGSFVNDVCKDNLGLPISCNGNTTGNVQGSITNIFNVFKTKLDGEDDNKNIIEGISCPKDTKESCEMSCPVDCIGYWENTGTCNVDRCDPSQNSIGLGKQTQSFKVIRPSVNQGEPCPGPTREVDCSLNNYIDCVQCGGLAGEYTEGAFCKNFKSCKRTIGIGEREDIWTADSLISKTNCIMKPNRIVPCEIPWEGCECRYDISDSRFCNENNIFCEDDTSVCTRNYTKIDELPGGICPSPNNIIRNPGDQLCTCRVERSFGPWKLESCDIGNIGTGTRTRTITIKKIGGYKGCKIIPESNEQLLENTTGILNVGGYFQFKLEVDFPGGTFETVQIENNVKDICSVNCVGDWSAWSACAVTCDGINSSRTGTRTRTYIITTPASNGGAICPTADNTTETDNTCSKTDCPVNCVGDWGTWTACVATCDGNYATAPRLGTRTRTYRVTRPVSNGGAICLIADNTTETDSTCRKIDCYVN